VTATPSIAILDYGMGNLRSVEKALERAGARVAIVADPAAAREAAGLVLPGVGAFPKAAARLRELGHGELVRERLDAGIPVLGICLGLQLLFDSSTELGGAEGIGLLPGAVDRLDAPGRKLPHIGWSPVRWERPSRLVEGIESEQPFYFVHTYAPRPAEPGDLLGSAAYGERFACAVDRDPLFGVQFHPEKSSAAGLRLLENFVGICAAGRRTQSSGVAERT